MLKEASDYQSRKISILILLIGLFVPFVMYLPEYIDIFFYIWYFIYILLMKRDAREPIAGGISLLVTLPLLLIVRMDHLAELAANSAFYLFFVGVLSYIIKFFSENKIEVIK